MGSEVLDDVISRFKLNNILFSQFFGVRSTYGLCPDYSEKHIQKRIKDLEKDIGSIEGLIKKEKKELPLFEKKMILQKLQAELVDLSQFKPYKKAIQVYAEPIANIIMVYVSRSYAPLDERIRDIINHEKGIPGFLNTGLEVLDKELSMPLTRMGMGFMQGVKSFLETELADFVTKSSTKSLVAEWNEVNKEAITAIDNFIKKLKDEYLPKCKEDFKLGEEQFLKLLEITEGISVTKEYLLDVAEKDLENNYNQIKQVLEKQGQEIFNEMDSDYPNPDELIQECQEIVNETKSYLKTTNLVTLPTDEDCKVVETPEFRRAFGIASMNLPGLAEPSKGKETYFYITKPDNKWNEEQTANFMKNFSRGSLHVTTIHEVFPGHFVQGLYYQNVIKSPLIRLFSFSGAISEGWAHYCEELIVDHGYDRYDKTKVKIGQLLGALKRNVRFICAVKMHCDDMTIDQAKELFKEKAYLSEESASMEAMRGTVDPMYLNYTLGKLMIKKLKEDVKKEKGKKFNEKEFHDSLLTFGLARMPLLRELMLKKTPVEEYL